MKLIYDNGKWKMFNLIQRDPAHYGTYTYVIDTDVDYIQDIQDGGNPSLNVGPFLFDNSLSNMNNGEIDIEMCKWGNPNRDSNTDWTIHPNDHHVEYNHFTGSGNTHTLTWTPQQIKFTVQGPSQPYREYVFTDASKIPPDTGKMQHILHIGQKDNAAPINGPSHYECEWVLRSYTFTPFQTDLASKSVSAPEPASAQSPTARSSGIFDKMTTPTNMFSSMPFSNDLWSGQTQGNEAQASPVSTTDSLWSGTSKPFNTNFKWPLAL
jgi:hypothetical protein